MSRSVTRKDIILGLREIGLQKGHKVMVHSSLSSLGQVEDGAPAVVEAFLEVLGTDGTLMVPTFTHSDTEYFDPLYTPSKNGAITEAARKFPGAVRSLHPTHAVTVIGPDARDLVCDDLDRGPLGKDCALDRLAKSRGWVFFLGVGHNVNSTIHVGEDYAGDPGRYARWNSENPKRIILNHPKQGKMEVLVTSMMGATPAFDKIEDVLRSLGQIVDGQIGLAKCQFMKGQDVIDSTGNILEPIFSKDSFDRNQDPTVG